MIRANTAAVLDCCISAAIAGVNWRRFVRPSRPDYEELCALMHIAEAELTRHRR